MGRFGIVLGVWDRSKGLDRSGGLGSFWGFGMFKGFGIIQTEQEAPPGHRT